LCHYFGVLGVSLNRIFYNSAIPSGFVNDLEFQVWGAGIAKQREREPAIYGRERGEFLFTTFF